MKLRTILYLLSVFLASSSAASAHPDECTNQTIKGSYAFTIHGQILMQNASLPVDGIARTTFDGSGGLTQVDAVVVGGNLPETWRPGWGTYTLNPDCTGTMTINTKDQPALHLAILVSRGGDLIHTVVTDVGSAVTSDAERILAPKPGDDWFRDW